MKKYLLTALAVSTCLLAACERKETTVVNPATPKVEKSTTIVNPPAAPATEKKTESTTVIAPGSTTTEKKTTEQPKP